MYLTAFLPAAGSVLQLNQHVWTYDSSGALLPTDSSTLVQTVLCSYDPNDKSVNPAGFISSTGNFIPGSVAMNTPLEYTIRFQNTGNDTAYTVVIRDTIDSEMDLSSLELEGGSHPFTASLDQNRVLTFSFNNILLPDSNIDEAGSHGFVQYRIHPKSTMPWTTYVHNTAYIYFDANAPVVTNTTQTLYDGLLGIKDPETSRSGIEVYPHPIEGVATVVFEHSPAEGYHVFISDLTGRKCLDAGIIRSASFELKTYGLSSGIYLLQAEELSTGLMTTRKIVVR
jgi:uncharacterized repeat protein (TIGR01451 family)